MSIIENSIATASLQASESMALALEITDPNVIAYLTTFADEFVRAERANEALKVGVIAIRSASPTLDTTVVQSKFVDLEGRMKDFLDEFMTAIRDDLAVYFKDNDGVVPRSINGFFGDEGRLGRTFQQYFDPQHGRLAQLMQHQIGPTSVFGRALDPTNKEGILAQIENRVQTLVETKMEAVLVEFSFDKEDSALGRLKKLLGDAFIEINQALGIKSATAVEAERGHVKGIEFEADLYEVFAELGRQLGDETENVRGVPGALRKKTGDYIADLGEATGAPDTRVVVEVKNQRMKLRDALDELQEAKKNREAAVGVFVFAKGCEPAEVGDFRRVGEDFICTVDKEQLAADQPLVFFDAAYRIARAMIVVSTRKESDDAVDWQQIKDHVDSLVEATGRLSDMATKARTIKGSGEYIEKLAEQLGKEFETRLHQVLALLRA